MDCVRSHPPIRSTKAATKARFPIGIARTTKAPSGLGCWGSSLKPICVRQNTTRRRGPPLALGCNRLPENWTRRDWGNCPRSMTAICRTVPTAARPKRGAWPNGAARQLWLNVAPSGGCLLRPPRPSVDHTPKTVSSSLVIHGLLEARRSSPSECCVTSRSCNWVEYTVFSWLMSSARHRPRTTIALRSPSTSVTDRASRMRLPLGRTWATSAMTRAVKESSRSNSPSVSCRF